MMPGTRAAAMMPGTRAAAMMPGTRAAAMLPDRGWSHGLQAPQTQTCLARFIKRASLGPPFLAHLPLRRLAAATLRERPVPLGRHEVAPFALSTSSE